MTMLFTRFFKSDRGASALEAAIIMPFLLLIYFGLQDLTGLITYNRKITATSATISDTVSQSTSNIMKSQIDDIFNTVGMIMQPVPDTSVHVDVYGFRMVSGAPTQRWKHSNTGGPTCQLPDTTNFTSMMTSSNDLVVSVTCVVYAPYIATFLGQNVLGATSFTLNQQIASRPRSSTQLDCYSTGTTLCTS